MAQLVEIQELLQDYNIEADDKTLAYFGKLCKTYSISPENIVDQWFAYSASNLRDATPSIPLLERMETSILLKPNAHKEKHNVVEPMELVEFEPIPVEEPKLDESSVTDEDLQPLPVDVKYIENLQDYIVRSFGSKSTFKAMPLEVTIKEDEGKDELRYMKQPPKTKMEANYSISKELALSICKRNDLVLTDKVDYQDSSICFGMILIDKSGSETDSVKLNIMNEGEKDCILLKLNTISDIALFSGQVVVVKGQRLNETFIPAQIYTDSFLHQPPGITGLNAPLEVVVAVGPFGHSGSYAPLRGLADYVRKFRPHCVVLLGPFLKEPPRGELGQEVQGLFEDVIDMFMAAIRGAGSRVVVCPSTEDVHHHPVYPTPPYTTKNQYEDLKFVWDPCVVDVNGVLIGATTVDVLFDLCRQELVKNNAKLRNDRLGRMCSHLINQKSFYPLFPPGKINLDYGLFKERGLIKQLPHVLIFPSRLQNFIKVIDGCLVINPETLIKNNKKGTFVRLEIPNNCEDVNRISCEILRI